jgi:thioesterase domain-containing protein
VPMNNQAMAGHRPPLFLIPGQAGDDLNCYVHVVANFPPAQTIHGLQPDGVVDAREFETIEETADYYIQAMRQTQPSGPYFLCGFCFGGLVAFEMAQQLHAIGQQVDFLGILDHRLDAGEAKFQWRPRDIYKFSRNLFYALADFIQVKEERAASLQRWFKTSGSPQTNGQPLTTCSQAVVDTDEIQRKLRIQEGALRRYQLCSYPGPISLFRPRRLPLQNPYDESLGWRKFAGGALDIQKLPIPGFQGYILRPPYASILAERVLRALEIAQTRSGALPPKASPSQSS